MKQLIIHTIIILFASFSLIAQQDPEELIQAVADKMNEVEKYSADVTINVDVEYINIDERKAEVFFEKPDKFEIKAKGIALLPRKGAQMEYLDHCPGYFSIIEEKSDTLDGVKTRLIKVIPTDPEMDIILARIWIDEKNLRIEKMQTYTKSTGSYLADFSYDDNPFDLPSKVEVEFDVEDMSLPASMTGDFESLSKKLERKGVTKGTVILEYSNYEVN